MSDIIAARAKLFAQLFFCPVCGAGPATAEKSDELETVHFACSSGFYLRTGGSAGVLNICPAPSHVAIEELERQAAKEAAKAGAA